jgi:hypothetical protein
MVAESKPNKWGFENISTLRNMNEVHDEIRKRRNSENACYYSV